MKKRFSGIFALLLLCIFPLQAEEQPAQPQPIEKPITHNIKTETSLPDTVGSKTLPTATAEQFFVYSSQAGATETVQIYNAETLEVHSYITAIGYLMEFIKENKNPAYINVRFQGSIFAIAKEDIARYIFLDELKSFPHYINENGQVMHYVEGNPVAENSWYFKAHLGTAPAWMQPNKEYYSFDGNHFFENITDLGEEQPEKHAINKGYPYYPYYLYLPMRSKTTYTALDISRSFNQIYHNSGYTGKTSKLINSANHFLEAEAKYGINALFLLSIAMNESAFGTSGYAIEQNNLFGYNAVDSYPDNADKFPNVKTGILEVANLLSWSYGDSDYEEARNYYGAHLGNKASGMNVKYASDPFWGEKAATNMWFLDSQLDYADFQHYALGIAKQETKVTWDERLKDQAFIYKKSTSSLIDMYPIILLDDNRKTKIMLEPPYNANKTVGDLTETGGEYNWYHGYTKKKNYFRLNDAKE